MMTSSVDWHKCAIVLASFVNMCLIGSHIACFSLFYPAITRSFRSSLGVTGWVGSLSQAMVFLPAVAYSSLLTKYGCRIVALIGTLLASLGYISSSFTTSVTQLYFTYGIVSGLGMGMLFLPTVVIVQQHFVHKPALASGLSLSGLSIGVVILSSPIQYCINTFGWRGALLIFGSICLHGFPCSTLFTKVQTNAKYKKISFSTSTTFSSCGENDEHTRIMNGKSNNGRDVLTPLLSDIDPRYGLPQQNSTATSTSIHETKACDNHVTRNGNTGIRSLLKDFSLIFYGLGTFCMNIGMIIFNMHTPNRSLKYGISPAVVAILPTAIALGNIAARISFSFIANLSCTNRTMQYSLGLLMAGLVSIGYSFTTTFWPICILCAGEGFFNGMAMTVQPTVLVDLFSVEMLPKSHSILNLFVGSASLLATPFGGFLYDINQNYSIPFIVGGCIEVLGFLFILLVVFKQGKTRKEQKSKRQEEPDLFVKSSP